MKFNQNFFIGISILLILIISYFVKIETDEGINFIVQDTLLGILIFHNPFILALYILGIIVLIVSGLEKNKKN